MSYGSGSRVTPRPRSFVGWLVWWLFVAWVIYMIATQPSSVANVVETVVDFLKTFFQGLGTVFSKVAS